jgi:hypothetical protein
MFAAIYFGLVVGVAALTFAVCMVTADKPGAPVEGGGHH